MKHCTKCGVEKSLEEFSKQKTGKDGRRASCKACYKAYYKANKEKINVKQKAWRDSNKGKIAERGKAWRDSNKGKIAERGKAYYEANKKKVLARQKEYQKANKERINEYQKAWSKKRYAEDIEFRTKCLLRAETSRLGDYKKTSTIKLVGCSPIEFWKRNGSPSIEELEYLDIDHIVPLTWFDLSNPDHVRVACHWTNLQYLDCDLNRNEKKDRYAGRPDAILGYKEDFDIEKHVTDIIEFLDNTNY